MDIKILLEKFEEIYVNKCYEETNEKCLALDEYELAIMHMCLEILENKQGYDKSNYITKDLFVLLRNDPLNGKACVDDKVKNYLVKVKRMERDSNYSLDMAPEALWVFYALILLYANEKATSRHDGKLESKRHYFQVYAFFACICPKLFCALFFNQIYLFMWRVYEQNTPDILIKYFTDIKELWAEYNYLFSNGRNVVSGHVNSMFRNLFKEDSRLLRMLIKIERLNSVGFLAFDYKGRESAEEARLKKVINGIEYFQCFLQFLKEEIKEYIESDTQLGQDIEKVIDYAKELKEKFIVLLKEYDCSCESIEQNFSNIEELLTAFQKYCDDNIICLVDI